MKPAAVICQVPKQSAIASYLPGAYFHYSWTIAAADSSCSALGQFLKTVSATPGWVNALMSLRNTVVAVVGLKNLGGLGQFDPSKPEAEYRSGDRVGIFTLIENSPTEVLLGDKDKHLDVTLSVHTAPGSVAGSTMVTVTTVVHIHNLLGRLYMLPVTPLHKAIVPSVLSAIAGR